MRKKKAKSRTRNSVGLTTAAREVALDARTLEKRLLESKAYPDAAGRYRWGQIVSALAGDATSEKLAKLRAERRLAELALGERENRLIPVEWSKKILTDHLIAARTRFMGLPERLRIRFGTWEHPAAFAADLDREIRDTLHELAQTNFTTSNGINSEDQQHENHPTDSRPEVSTDQRQEPDARMLQGMAGNPG